MRTVALLPLYAATSLLAAPPVAVDDVALVTGKSQVTVDVLANDADPDPGTLLSLDPAISGAVYGNVQVTNGKVVYDATALTDTDLLTYTVTDGAETATAHLTVASMGVLKGTYAGLAEVTAGASGEPGNLQVEVSADAFATLVVVWQGQTYRGRKTGFDPGTGAASLVIAKADGSGSIDITMQLTPKHGEPAANHQLVGKLTDGAIEAAFTLGHVPFSGDEVSAKPIPGRYTSILQCDALSGFAKPGGFTHFTIPKSRRSARILVQMPDSELFSVGSPYAGRRYVINRRLYQGSKRLPGPGGFVSAEPAYTPPPAAMFARGAADFLSDRMSWQRGSRAGAAYYPGGISALRQILLSAAGYPKVSRGAPPPIGFEKFDSASNAEMVMEDGDLPQTIVKSLHVPRFGSTIKILENDVAMKLSMSGPTGLFNGSFVHPATGVRVKFKGVFDETLGQGVAAFAGPTVRGLVTIQPTH